MGSRLSRYRNGDTMTKPTIVIPPYRMGQIQQQVRVWDGNGRTMGEFPAGQQGWADARAVRDALTYYESYGEIFTEDQKITCLQNSLTTLILAARKVILNPLYAKYFKELIVAKNDATQTLETFGVKVELVIGSNSREDRPE